MPMAIRFGQDLVVPAMIYSAISLWALGSETAAARFDEAVAHALRSEHVPTIAYTHLHGDVFEMLRRDRAEALFTCTPTLGSLANTSCRHGSPTARSMRAGCVGIPAIMNAAQTDTQRSSADARARHRDL